MDFLMSAPQQFFKSAGFIPITAGLVGWWKFDEGAGATASDSSGNNNSGALTGTPLPTWLIPGKFGNALTFDGTQNFVNMGAPAALDLLGSLSLSIWFNKTSFSVGNLEVMIEKGLDAVSEQYLLRYNSDNATIAFIVNSAAIASFAGGAALANGAWHNAIGTFDGTTARLYIDGVLQSSIASAAPIHSTQSLYIGAMNLSGTMSRFFLGSLDDVRIYNRALLQAEVTSIFNGTG